MQSVVGTGPIRIDARRMAKDVDAALGKIIQETGGKSEDVTNEYVEKLKSDKRYKRDVY